jgi:exopolysaccharide production protein ExoZ
MREKIIPIQWLRGVAAMMVVWQHCLAFTPLSSAMKFTNAGVSGVDLFFVISGFIMVATTSGRSMSPIEFMTRRVIRLVPIYWAATILLAICISTGIAFRTDHVTLPAVLKSLFFIPYVSLKGNGQIWPVLGQGWTLNYEMFFYVVFALTLLVRNRLFALVTVFVLLVLAGAYFGPFKNPIALTYTSPLLLEFVMGAVIGTLWSHGWRPSLEASLTFICLGIFSFALHDYTAEIPSQLVGASLLVAGSLNEAFGAIKARILTLLGDASYSIYITHVFTIMSLHVFWKRFGMEPPFIIMFVAAPAVGIIIFRIVEYPMTRWLQNMWRQHRTTAGPLPETVKARF